SVTVDSPEKQRGDVICWCHGAADQAWSSADVIAAVVFELTPSGCDLSTDTTPCQCVGHGGVASAGGRSVGEANDRSRRDSVSGQNTEQATSASAMAMHNNRLR